MNRVHGDGRFTWAPPEATESVRLIGIRFGSNKFTAGGAAPEVGAAGMEEGASKSAKRTDQLVGIATLKGGTRKLQKEPLKGLIRLRRDTGLRISCVGCQCAPIIWLSG